MASVHLSFAFVVTLCASLSHAQSFYVDLESGLAPSPPSAAYGAAVGIPGVWNSAPASDWPFALQNVHGQPTSVTFTAFACESGSADLPGATGDDALLLEDWLNAWGGICASTFTFRGLAAGTYQLFVLCAAPTVLTIHAAVHPQDVIADGSTPGNLVVPPFPGTFAGAGFWYELVVIPADAAQIDLQVFGSVPVGGVAGIQLVRLDEATPFCTGHLGNCRCGVGASNAGCPSSFAASGAALSGSGSQLVSSDTLHISATNLSSSVVTLFQGTQPAGFGSGTAFGDGLRCAGGQLVRIVSKLAVGGVVTYPEGSEAPVSVRGGVPASGGLRTYQVGYRDAANHCTNSTFNWTNGVAVLWRP